ncbi:MAG: hypothetical protein ACOC8N_01840, partial [Spirochaetota bacterium]
DVVPVSVEEAVLDAQVLGVARVVSINTRATRCTSSTDVLLVAERYLLGVLDQQELLFSYTHYLWKKAFWPWQEDCPSVQYTLPPIAEGMEEGVRVLFTARYFSQWDGYFATGTVELDRLEEVERMLEARGEEEQPTPENEQTHHENGQTREEEVRR